MKRIPGVAFLFLGLLSGAFITPNASAFDPHVEAKLPQSGLDAIGLPIHSLITGVYTIPQNTNAILADNGGSAEDIAEILNLKNTYIFLHDSINNGPAIASLFVEGGLFEDPYQDGNGHICGPNRTAVGRDAIAAYFGNTGPAVPMTKHTHHVYTAPIVKIDQTGQFATLIANYADDKASVTGVSPTSWSNIGEYVDDFVKISGRWWIVHLRPLYDQIPTAGTDPCATN
jgi:SnoaL-like domain